MKTLTTEKNKYIVYFLFAIVLALSFYSFEFFNDFSEEYTAAIKSHSIKKKNRTKALNKVKSLAEGTPEYIAYLEAKKETDKAYNSFKEVKKKEKVFGFKSFKFFMERLGLWFGVFLYSIFNLFNSFRQKKKFTGVKLIHGLIISVCFFYFFWIFQQFQDVSKVSYYFATIVSAVFVVLAVYLIAKYRKDRINSLQDNLMEVAKFTFKNTKPEKREEMLDMIKKIATNK
ncbi:hypothetical protein [Tenacibaculum sp. 190130A14a]|uniref:hypothetical protein n=1 Tax=Tenacibaculum polynesiense TaxID=3137857 RepID=UPI0032B1301D